MALVGISRTDTFTYVSNDDPCKRVAAKTQPAPDGGAPILTGEKVTIIDDGATRFKLGVLDVFLMGMIYDNSTKITRGIDDSSQVDFKTAVNATNIETVRFGLLGWEGFKQVGTNNDIAFVSEERIVMGRKYQAASDDMLNLLGIRLITELADQIKTASEVTKAEAKNSDTAS